MNFFKRAPATVETVPPETDEQRLVEIEAQYREAERAFTAASFAVARYRAEHKHELPKIWMDAEGHVSTQVNAQFADAELARLEAEQARARATRSHCLSERARLLMKLGKIR